MAGSRHKTQEISAVPDWLPDWKDAGQYPDSDTTLPSQWGWEFLRRNPDYRQTWEKCIKPYIDSDGDYDAERAMTDAEEEAEKQMALAEGNNEGFTVTEPARVIMERFGLSPLTIFPPCPSQDRPSIYFEGTGIGHRHKPVSFYKENKPYKFTQVLENFESVIHFDLRRPLKKQFADAKRLLDGDIAYLKSHGLDIPKQKRYNPSLFPTYLRLLDAQETGATYLEMQASIDLRHTAGSRQTIRDSLKAAMRLRDRDYRFFDLHQGVLKK